MLGCAYSRGLRGADHDDHDHDQDHHHSGEDGHSLSMARQPGQPSMPPSAEPTQQQCVLLPGTTSR